MNAPRELYNKTADIYDVRHTMSPMTGWLEKHEKVLMERFCRGKTIELGCGTGRWLGNNRIGMDISERMLAISKGKGFGPLIQGDAECTPFKTGSFDTVLCLFGTLNMCDYRKAVGEISRITRPGGTAMISIASMWDGCKNYLVKRRTRSPKKTKKLRIYTERMRLYLFEKNELIKLFSMNGFRLEHFSSLFILQNPRWGSHERFSLLERVSLYFDRFFPQDYGAMYLMVFRKG